jgi:argininosuccinate lyase
MAKTQKLWGGAFEQNADQALEEFWGSIRFDQRLSDVDVMGCCAHAKMLGRTGIISADESALLVQGLQDIAKDIEAGRIEFLPQDEDIHMNIERILHTKIGAVAGKLHTGRSRNDQVALDMHLFVRKEAHKTIALIKSLMRALVQQAETHIHTILPGYTHLQRAQPVTFAHHLLAYVWMLKRDIRRLEHVIEMVSLSPLGSGALAGTTFPIDREFVAQELGFAGVYPNSMDGVSNRDFVVDFLSANALTAAHLSRFCEEIILWVSSEFGFMKLSDAYCTGSSMMPQKKNADLAELVRGKTGRVYGALMSMLTIIKGVPLSYNKDFQEDKECLFDSIDTVQQSVFHLTGLVQTFEVRVDKMRKATKEGFLNATDVADYLAGKNVPFREAHEVAAKLVAQCLKTEITLEDLTLEQFQAAHPKFDSDIFEAIRIETVLARRSSKGGPASDRVKEQIDEIKQFLGAV